MKLATICPPGLLDQVITPDDNYHLVLVHIALHNKKYLEFYRERSDQGQHVILDNGAFEHGVSRPISELIEVAVKLKPTEIVLPDERFGSEEVTLDLATQSLNKLQQHGGGWLFQGMPRCVAVPHGRTWVEYVHCAQALAEFDEVSCIAVVGETADNWGKHRVLAAKQLHSWIEKPIHMFGCLDDLSDITHPWIRQHTRGFDTGKFVQWGLSGYLVTADAVPPYPGRSKTFFETNRKHIPSSSFTMGTIQENVQYWRQFVASVPEEVTV